MSRDEFIKLQIGACEARYSNLHEAVGIFNTEVASLRESEQKQNMRISSHVIAGISDAVKAELAYWKSQ